MNREIKFRVTYKTDERLDNKLPGWIVSEPFELQSLSPVGNTTQFDFSDGSYLGTDDVDWYGELEWMQFTGLKDKNGKEIYEGDILRLGKNTNFCITDIRFQNGTFGWFDPKTEKEIHWFHELSIFNNEAKIIGNIYENPELLK